MRLLQLMFIVVVTAWSAPASGQEPAPLQTPDRPPEGERPTAPVVLDGVTLFRVRGISAYPAARRAQEIAARIAAVASNRSIPVDSVVVRETPHGSALVAAGQPLFSILDADAELEGATHQVLAEVYRPRVAQAIERYRSDREPAVFARSVARASMATLALMLGLWLWFWAMRRLRGTLEQRYRPRLQGIQFQSIELVRGERLWHFLHRGLRLIATLLALMAVYACLNYVLLLFPGTRTLGQDLKVILLRPITTLGAGAIHYLPDVVFLVVLWLVVRFILNLVRLFFRGVDGGTLTLRGFEPEWAQPTERIVRLAVIALSLVVAYPHIPGSGSEAFKGITLLLGLIFSLGSPSLIGNIVAGQSLAYRRAFKVGDRVRIGEHVGEVAQVRLLTTYLRTPKNEQIVIPNSLILNADVVNFSAHAQQQGLILHTTVGIGYQIPWRTVEAMLLEAAGRTPGLLPEPSPFVLQKTLGTFAVEYEINAYCDTPRLMPLLYSALHRNILDVFNEYGVQIMTPAYEGDPESPKVVPPQEWFTPPARPNDPAQFADPIRLTP
jgi:small-conductance mechanosensitive channel